MLREVQLLCADDEQAQYCVPVCPDRCCSLPPLLGSNVTMRTQATVRVLRAATNVHDHHIGAVLIGLCSATVQRHCASQNITPNADQIAGGLTGPCNVTNIVVIASALLEQCSGGNRGNCAPSPLLQSSDRPRLTQTSLRR